MPQQPVTARVEVETLRRDRSSCRWRLSELRAEREALAAHDPIQLRAALEQAEAGRAAGGADEARGGRGRRRRRLRAPATSRRPPSARPPRPRATVNRAWREASTELDRLRETYEEEDRLRGDIERRVSEAERLLREGHGVIPPMRWRS